MASLSRALLSCCRRRLATSLVTSPLASSPESSSNSSSSPSSASPLPAPNGSPPSAARSSARTCSASASASSSRLISHSSGDSSSGGSRVSQSRLAPTSCCQSEPSVLVRRSQSGAPGARESESSGMLSSDEAKAERRDSTCSSVTPSMSSSISASDSSLIRGPSLRSSWLSSILSSRSSISTSLPIS